MYQEPVNERLHHAERLRQHEQAPAIDTVGDRAAERAEHETRHGVEKTDHAQEHGRARQLPDEPGLRDVLHEIAGGRDERAIEEQAEVAVAERAQRREFPEMPGRRIVVIAH
jgi:hypothetical protein